ncbi:unnamed protein product [Schistocephalus solidus]|uniref:Solute carrier family 22 member 5 n=1 Tax=Schistocephalus solidus TaxID=70667 RepID=A0A183SGW9_SCHSO|nr:unnamed protein product [Schistocephalus solidus]
MDDPKVDEALAGIVQPAGFWQFIVVILATLTIPGAAIISVFNNSFPKHRCRLEPQVEAWLLNTSSTSPAAGWDIRSIAEVFGPKLSHPSSVSACELYTVDRLQNTTLERLLLYQNQTLPLERQKCPFGFVYEYDWHQFPGGLVKEWDLVCDRAWEVPFNESIYMLGMLIGFLVGGWFGDRFGRRPVILASGVVDFILELLICFSVNHTQYIILRILVAVCSTTRFSALTVLITEITTAKYRSLISAVSSIIQMSFQRIFLAVVALYVTNWRWLNASLVLTNSLIFILFFILPESPKWLVARARYRDAGDVLYRGYRMNARVKSILSPVSNRSPLLSKNEFFALIGIPDASAKDKLDEEHAVMSGHSAKRIGKFSIFPLFNRSMAVTTFLCTILIAGHITCVFGLAFYSANIRFYTSYVLIINALSSIPGSLLFAGLYRCFRFRKRPLLVIYLVTAAVLWIAALYTLILQPKNDIVLNVLMAVVTMTLAAGSRMVFVYVPELYSPVYRNRGLGVCAGLARLGVFWFPLINRLDSSVRHGFPLTIYAGLITIQMIVLCFLRDTNGEAPGTERTLNCGTWSSQHTGSLGTFRASKPREAPA